MQTNFYFDFENKFRGNREAIMKQFSSYDKLVEKVVENNSFNRFVDIGCGRGEWVEKWKDKVEDTIGIECDAKMIDVCRSNGLNVIEGNATDIISKFKDHSISLVTIFHVIEHLDHKQLIELLEQIERVLTNEGVLIMETPSIDNLIVSTKMFYLDHTHINHINPDGIKFSMENLGLKFVKYFYIHGGALQNSSPLKITRLLNGVAQDLLIVSTKSKSLYEKLFVQDTSIEDDFQIAITTLDAAVEHDLQFEHIFQEQQKSIVEQSNQVNLLKQEIILLKAHLKYPIYLIKFLKKIFKPIYILIKLTKKIIIFFGNKIIIFLLKYSFLRNILLSAQLIHMMNYIFKNILGASTEINSSKILKKFNQISEVDLNSKKNNQNLLIHFANSPSSKNYKELLCKKFSNKQ